jgi:uncharacterized LabA/DUF88 family protein
MFMKTAILVDGSFFIKRYRTLYHDWREKSTRQIARDLYAGLLRDLRKANKGKPCPDLYRILFYDCPPLEKRAQNPVSRKGFSFSDTPEARFRKEFHNELKKFRKVALRLGRIADEGQWVITPEKTKALLNGRITVDELTEKDVRYEARQKGVDMKIGLDISSLSHNKNVEQIILVAGDSDFVPAAKQARREGIDFVLDPMWNHINPDLHEHIDGLVSSWPKNTGP